MRLIGVDVGGTFTDLVLADTETGSVTIHKVPTTPEDPSVGVADGIGGLCDIAAVSRAAVDHVLHGTTIATNAALEHRGAECGMITTRGYRDILHIGRHQRPQHYSIRMALKHDYLAFRSHERRFRNQLGLPPHTRLLNCRVEGTEEEKVRTHIQTLEETVAPCLGRGAGKKTRLIGPAPCPLERIQNRFRWQFLIATGDARVRKALLENLGIRTALLKQPSNLRVIVDVDPVNLL